MALATKSTTPPGTPPGTLPVVPEPLERAAPDPALLLNIRLLWAKLLEASMETRRLRLVLADMTPLSLSSEELVVSPHASVVLSANSLKADLQALVLRLTGRRLAIVYQTPQPDADAGQDAQSPEGSGPPQAPVATIESVSAHPLVQRAIELLGGRVIGVQARKKTEGSP